MSGSTTSARFPPPGHKPLAWQGVGLFVPLTWDIGRHAGTYRQGGFRIDNEYRVVVQVKWWQTRGPVSLDRAVQKHLKQGRQREAALEPATGLAVPSVGRAAGFRASIPAGKTGPAHDEVIVVAQEETHTRAAMWRFTLADGEPDARQINAMLRGLRLQLRSDGLDWAALDFSLRSPPEYDLQKAVLASGVCYLRFGRRMSQVAFRRFSTAPSLEPGEEAGALTRWCRVAYANDFYDVRYQIEASRDRLMLSGRRPLIALPEFKGLIPGHRRPPRHIDIRWDREANKIYAIEVSKLRESTAAAAGEMADSIRMTLPVSAASGVMSSRMPDPLPPRLRALHAVVMPVAADVTEHEGDRGNVQLRYQVIQPPRLRLMRLLAGQPVGTRTRQRILDLDRMGSAIWRQIRRRPRVMELVESLMRDLKISYREAELSVAHYIKVLGQRGLLSVKME